MPRQLTAVGWGEKNNSFIFQHISENCYHNKVQVFAYTKDRTTLKAVEFQIASPESSFFLPAEIPLFQSKSASQDGKATDSVTFKRVDTPTGQSTCPNIALGPEECPDEVRINEPESATRALH
jgi:hypothetical protein